MENEIKNAASNLNLVDVTDAASVVEDFSETDKKIGKFVVLGIGACVLGTVVSIIVRKNKDKIYSHLAKKLEKQGYLVVGPNEPHGQDVVEENLDDMLNSDNN